ncbi:MAG: shikimate kinase [Alphaproteobacteria bacterium]|nr:shikimate kinase [Alphaproteobacteria bacterium]
MSTSNLENFSLKKSIALLGMMGAGKTSVGRALANIVSIPFYDSDAEIEKAMGLSIPRIFAERGEPEFRRIERETVAHLLDERLCVLSLGGGAFIDAQTREEIRKKAISIWLKVDRDILLKRVMYQGNRPLLAGNNPKEKLDLILRQREPIYAQADVTVLLDDAPVYENAHKILAALSRFYP